MQPIQFNWPIASANSIALLQTLAGAGALNLNGALLYQPALPTNTFARMSDAVERKITLTSTGNISGVNFTIVGKNYQTVAVTEVLAGPNNNTVTSVNNYYEIDSITANGAVGTATSAGIGTTGVTAWVLGDHYPSTFSAALYINILTTAMSVTVEATPDDPGVVASPALFPHSLLTAVTVNDSSEWPYPYRYVRFKVNSSDATGTGKFTVHQSGR